MSCAVDLMGQRFEHMTGQGITFWMEEFDRCDTVVCFGFYMSFLDFVMHSKRLF